MRIRSSLRLLASGTAMALLLCPPLASAASIGWSGTVSNSWFVDGNWIGGPVPTSADDATIGTGMAEIAGSGSDAHVNSLIVGGNGTLQVETGGSFTSVGAVTLGNNAGSGSIAVSGTSHFTADSIAIGNDGAGSFEVTAGGTANIAHDAFIARLGSSSGDASISGGGTTWTIAGNLDVGDAGIGTMDISTGAAVSDVNATIGDGSGSNGSAVTISGLGSRWANSGALVVGNSGNATLGIFSSATVSSASAVIGRHATGTVSVGGSSSRWTSGALTIGGDAGNIGTGMLDISGAGEVDSASAILGYSSESSGTVTVDGGGSFWDVTNLVSVGYAGSGEVKITNGAHIRSAGAETGAQSGGSGDVLITGSGSNWTSSGAFYIGAVGSGSLEITAGGSLADTDGYVGYGDGSLGSGSGTAFANGSGSAWTNSGTLHVGTNNHSKGTVTISGAGKISDVNGIIGDGTGSIGTLTVSGSGSSWLNSGNVAIGLLGDGTLNVILGGNVAGVTGSIGSGLHSTGVAKVTGNGSVWSSTGAVTVGDAGSGTLTIADGGTVSASAVTIAAQSGSTGTVNIGAALGQTAAGYATLDTHAIHFGSGTGTLVFNFGGPAYVTDAAIDGRGTIDVVDGSVTLTGNSGAFSGTTNVTGGSLAVNGILGGNLSVSGGTLAGTGTVGTTQVSSGGTISPGDSSAGTLTVNGNLALGSGATYRADVGFDGSDSIHSTGTTTIGSGSTLDLVGSQPVNLGSHTILSADGGLTGSFSTLKSETTYAFVDPSLVYNGGTVAVNYARNDTSFASAGQTSNQSSVGGAIESLGNGNSLYNAVVGLASNEVSGAFKQLTGDLHTSSTAMTFDNSRFSRTVGIDRLRSASGDVGASGATSYVLGGPAPTSASGSSGPLGYAEPNQSLPTPAELATQSILSDPRTASAVVWAEGYGGWGRTDGDANAAGVRSSTGGVMFGIEGPVADSSWRLGVMGGYSRTSFDQDGENASGDSDNYDIGLYGGSHWGPLALRLGALYTRQNLSTQRSVLFPGFAETLSADYNADAAQAFGELGYTIDSGPVQFEPFGNLAYVHLHTDSFSESGGAAALSSDAQNSGITFTTLGLRSSTNFSVGGVPATACGSLGWRHAFGDTDTLSTFAFAGGSDFTVAGNAVARDAMVLEAGMDLAFSPFFTWGLTYSGDYAKAAINQTVKTTLSVRF